MKKQLFVLAGMMSLLGVNAAFGWDLWVNSDKNNTVDVRVDVRWGGIFCSDDTFTLSPGASKRIGGGSCDVTSIHVNHPYGERLDVTKATGNPVNGVRIITINRGQKNEKLKVVRNEDLSKYGITK